MTTQTKPREVELLVCEVCDRVGKLPVASFGGKSWCQGPFSEKHKRVPMVKRTFVEKSA